MVTRGKEENNRKGETGDASSVSDQERSPQGGVTLVP